jgi:glycosyltransferase involved in cell wall biosynthesis
MMTDNIVEMNKPMQGDLPLVSVIIPSFNNESFIGPAIESLFRQTYSEEKMEIIVVDDGSTDNTLEVLAKYEAKIVLICHNHRGIAAARNAGISRARGEIITFLDSDDIWHELRVEKVVEKFMEKPEAGMVYHPVELIDSAGAKIFGNFYDAFGYREGLSGRVANEIASGSIFSGGSSFSLRKGVARMIFPIPEDIRRGVDYYMNVISSCYAPVEYVPEILGKYRLHKGNLTMSEGPVSMMTLIAMNKDFAHTRQRVMEKLSELHTNQVNFNIIRRIQAKEMIFYNVLSGRRHEGIRQIPALFKDSLSLKELLWGVAVSGMAFFVPASLYPRMLGVYRFSKRLKIVTF